LVIGLESNAAPFPIVGNGASAGGLRALENFFRPLPPAPGMAFVIVTHLAPDRKSLFNEILARHTSLKVELAHHNQRVEKDKLYILPPGAILTIADRRQISWASRIIRHLREFVANGEPNITHQSLHNLIRESLELTLAGVSGAKIHMVFALNADRDRVLVNKVEIKQVLVISRSTRRR
jgi:hypothetical protein